jgi:hypothetical protein
MFGKLSNRLGFVALRETWEQTPTLDVCSAKGRHPMAIHVSLNPDEQIAQHRAEIVRLRGLIETYDCSGMHQRAEQLRDRVGYLTREVHRLCDCGKDAFVTR